MKSSANSRWFSVKSVFRWVVSGTPKGENRAYSKDSTLVEERIVIVQGKDGKEALAVAAREAKSYAKHKFGNLFGQEVRLKFLETLEIYELFDQLESGTEVYSQTELVSTAVSDREVRLRKFGKPEKKGLSLERNPRLKFVDAEMFQALYEPVPARGKSKGKGKPRTARARTKRR